MSRRREVRTHDALRKQAASQAARFFADLQRLVETESPSDNKRALDLCGDLLKAWALHLGARARVHAEAQHGDHLQIDFPGQRGREPLLLLGHFDTVWPMGTLPRMPFRIENERVWGPGVLDMKGGIAIAFHAIAALRQVRGKLPRPITVLLVSDEEIGSPSSRPITEKLARDCEAVYVLEPAHGPEGACKTERKGVGEYRIAVHGRASHAGLDFSAGANAILEMARQIERIASFTNLPQGITVNAGIIQGGSRPNVVPAECVAEVDVRICRPSQAKLLDRKFHALRPFDSRCTVEVAGGINRPPMERTRKNVALFRKARAIARELGFDLQEQTVGGGSDGNFTSALGIPTLDGLGAVGQGAHAADESIMTSAVVPRITLLAALLEGEAG